jgi:hypothetical protein
MSNLNEYFEKVKELDKSLTPFGFRVYTYIRFRKYTDGNNGGYIGNGIHIRTLDLFKEAVGNLNFSFPINIDEMCQVHLEEVVEVEDDSSRVFMGSYHNPEYRLNYIQMVVHFAIRKS